MLSVSSQMRCANTNVFRNNQLPRHLLSASRRVNLRTVAFRRDMDPLLQAAAQFPTIFHGTPTTKLEDVVSDHLVYHTSFWYHDLIEHHGRHRLGPGLEPYEKSLETFLKAYTQVGLEVLDAVVDAKSKDAFLLYGASVQNTDEYLGNPPTNKVSHIAGSYRLKFDNNNRISDVWLYRSGTEEEREHLLKDTRIASGDWMKDVTLYPMTWPSSRALRDNMDLSTEKWHREVVSKGSMKTLVDLVAPDVQYYDGIGFTLSRPLVGVRALEQFMAARHADYTSGGCLELAQASCDNCNRVFVHWTHTLMHRQTGLASPISGITLLVFDHNGKIVQIVDFSEPTNEQRAAVYRERHLMPISAAAKRE